MLRPWLKPFLGRCFANFEVAFWDSKSVGYMDDVVSTMLSRLLGPLSPVPLFVWSGKHCEVQEIEDGAPKVWEKNLSLVYSKWLCFNALNTVIVDSKMCWVGCNADVNVISSTPFYINLLRSLSDDKDYLKCYMWPLLEVLNQCQDVPAFWSKYPQIVIESMEQMIQKQHSGKPYEFLDILEGEGAWTS